VQKKNLAAAIATGLILTLGTAGIASAHGMGGKNGAKPEQTAKLTLITSTIGIDVATLKTRLQAGDSLATIAGSKTAALITALVAAKTKEIDAALAAGKLTAAKATTLKTNLTAHITEKVNQVRGPGMGKVKGKGHGMGKGHGRP
jgi:hypothetical protein